MVTALWVHGPPRVRRTLSRSPFQARATRHRTDGNTGSLFLRFAGRNRLGSGGLRQRRHNGMVSTCQPRRAGERVGYRIGSALKEEGVLDPPELTSTIDELGRDLEGILVAQGLYQDEARAMVETWRDSWFEEGSRLLYIVPPAFVNEVLPLSINPAPAQTVRVFVGRLELITPATEQAVKTAFATQDAATLKAYGRFLEPILATMIKKETNAARTRRFQEYLNFVYSRLIEQNLGRN